VKSNVRLALVLGRQAPADWKTGETAEAASAMGDQVAGTRKHLADLLAVVGAQQD